MKNLKILIILLLGIVMPKYVFASDDGTVAINTETALKECLQTSGICKLTGDIELTSLLDINKDVILDLNGQVITPSKDLKLTMAFINVKRGAKLTINDSKGTGKISTGAKDNSNVWGGIQLAYGESDTTSPAELVVNNGTIEGYYYGIVGHGKYHNTKITINGGNIVGLNEEDSLGIYHPQEGTLTVNNGIIQGGTGIEMRAGTLNISDGTIKATAPKFVKTVNAAGSTTNGVGVAIAQHTTKKPIDVTISGGDISGQYALYEWNPHKNSSEDIAKVKLKITGGKFVGTATGVDTIYSEDLKNFVTGGTFNKDVDKYKSEDSRSSSTIQDTETNVDAKSSEGVMKWLIGPSLLLATGAGIFIYRKIC